MVVVVLFLLFLVKAPIDASIEGCDLTVVHSSSIYQFCGNVVMTGSIYIFDVESFW